MKNSILEGVWGTNMAAFSSIHNKKMAAVMSYKENRRIAQQREGLAEIKRIQYNAASERSLKNKELSML